MSLSPRYPLTSLPAKRRRKFNIKKLEELKEIHRLKKIVALIIAKPTLIYSFNCLC